jgi:hypoxanthine-DNA glycosylase
MKGKSTFSTCEVGLIESLIRQRCNAGRSEQKNIRDKMRSLGFYGRDDYGIVDMTIEKFRKLIESGRIKVTDAEQSCSKSAVVVEQNKNVVVNQHMKSGLEAWVGDNPVVLILGTFPGEKSLATQAYYQDRAHNSFYKIIEQLFERPVGMSDRDFITKHHIALWDCMKEADRPGSLDSNIKSYVPNDIEGFLNLHPTISTIILNGTGGTTKIFEQNFSVAKLKQKYNIIQLPSTSNSFSIMSFDEKKQSWQVLKKIVDENIEK